MKSEERQALQNKIESNKHEVYVISFEEMDAVIRSSGKQNDSKVKAAWASLRDNVGVGANYYASADDALTLARLVSDLGGVGARAYIKTYGGKPHIILKGRPGLRHIFTGTRYGINNPKVISMGLGKAGARAAAKQGGILTVVLLTTYRVTDYFLTDEATLSQLIGTLATDVVKVGISTAAAIGAATLAGGLTLAIGPILAVVVVGVGVSMLVEYVDNSLGITNRVIAGIEEVTARANAAIEKQKENIVSTAEDAIVDVVDLVVDSAKQVAVQWVKQALSQYLNPARRIR